MPCLIIASYALIIATYAIQTENDPRKSAVALHVDADSSRDVSDAVLFNRFNRLLFSVKNIYVERTVLLKDLKF